MPDEQRNKAIELEKKIMHMEMDYEKTVSQMQMKHEQDMTQMEAELMDLFKGH